MPYSESDPFVRYKAMSVVACVSFIVAYDLKIGAPYRHNTLCMIEAGFGMVLGGAMTLFSPLSLGVLEVYQFRKASKGEEIDWRLHGFIMGNYLFSPLTAICGTTLCGAAIYLIDEISPLSHPLVLFHE